MILKNNRERGAAALVIVVIIGVVSLLLAAGAAYLGMGELNIAYNYQKGGEDFAFTDGCAEEALRQLRLNSGYAGGSLNLDGGSCIISVLANGNNRVIDALGTVGVYTKKIEINLILTDGVITINNWQEVSP